MLSSYLTYVCSYTAFSFNAMIILKKADKPCENRSGFYVEKIAPVPGFTDLG